MSNLLFGQGFLGSAFQNCEVYTGDIFNYEQLVESVKNFSCVLNCVVDRRRNKNKAELNDVNVVFPEMLVAACAKCGVKLIHFSTLYSGNYDGYTQTKEESEKVVSRYSKSLVVRLPVLLDGKHNDCLISQTINRCLNNKPVELYQSEFISPLFTNDVVDFVNNTKATGIIDLVGSSYLQRIDIAEYVSKKAKLNLRVKLVSRKKPKENLKNPIMLFGSLEKKITKCLEQVNLLRN